MGWAPERGDARTHTGERVGARAAGEAPDEAARRATDLVHGILSDL